MELLVVIAIIAIIAAMLLPATQKAITNAKNNRALAEMAQFAAIIQLVYSEVGYYVRLEDVAKASDTTTTLDDDDSPPTNHPYRKANVRNWKGGAVVAQNDYTNQRSDNDNEVRNNIDAQSSWAGPYTTIKKYVVDHDHEYPPGNPDIDEVIGRPTDPWGQEYRMYWSDGTGPPSIKPAGASGTMVIISAGANKILDTFGTDGPATATISGGTVPVDTDLYFNFNAGIQ